MGRSRTMNISDPMVITSPLLSGPERARCPLTNVPLRLPASSIERSCPLRLIDACWRDTRRLVEHVGAEVIAEPPQRRGSAIGYDVMRTDRGLAWMQHQNERRRGGHLVSSRDQLDVWRRLRVMSLHSLVS